jgi:multidrug resistance efflux pump
MVKPGDVIKSGQELMKEDTALAESELAVLKAASDETGAVQEAQVQIDAKTKLLEMLQGANASGREILDAQLDRDVATARKVEAEDEHKQKVLEYQRQLVRVQHMTLVSPVDGIVEKIALFEGELVDPNKPDGAIIIVKNDPLWVEMHLVSSQAAKLKTGDTVQVAYPDEPQKWLDAKVIFLDPVVESGSDTQTVRVALPNPSNRPSGLTMSVRLPEKVFADQSLAGVGGR